MRFSFRFPKHKSIVLIDPSGLGLISEYVDKKNIAVIDINNMNFWVVLRMLVSRKKSLSAYTYWFLHMVKPEFVLTFIDNNVNFYELSSKFPHAKFIAIQNGNRANYANQIGSGFFDLLKNAAEVGKLSCYAICVFGKNAENQFSKYIDSRYMVIGSLKNNFISSNLGTTRKYDIVYVSQHAPYDISSSYSKFYFDHHEISAQKFYEIESRVVRYLAERSRLKGETFAVLGKRTKFDEFEQKFFQESTLPYSIEFLARTSDYSTYEFCNSASLIVTIDSAMGYEFLSRGKKVAFLSSRIHAADQSLSHIIRDTDFGFPLTLEKTGPFWTNIADDAEFERVINTVQGLSQVEWASMISPYTDVLMAYQPGNSAFIQLLQEEGIPVRNEVLHRA